MNRTLTPWLLGGALAASLSWNYRLSREEAPPSCASDQSCAGFDTAELDLDAEQRAALAELCQRSCCESDRLEQRAERLQHELLARLARPEVDVNAARELVAEVGELRRRSLEACVEGILAVRSVLTPAQVTALLEQCQPGRENCAGTECAPSSAGPEEGPSDPADRSLPKGPEK